MAHGNGSKVSDNEVTLQIGTPKGPFTGTFPKTTKVEDVIEAVVEAKGLDNGESLELVYNGEVLTPVTRPLVSFGLAGTVELELVASGSGV
jgi:hypothetical protein